MDRGGKEKGMEMACIEMVFLLLVVNTGVTLDRYYVLYIRTYSYTHRPMT